MIIIRGATMHPQDIERTAEASHPALRAGCGVALSVDVNGAEHFVVVNQQMDGWRPTASRSSQHDDLTGNCMDYTTNPAGPPSNEHPNAHDYAELETIYGHLDSFNTPTVAVAVAVAVAGRAGVRWSKA